MSYDRNARPAKVKAFHDYLMSKPDTVITIVKKSKCVSHPGTYWYYRQGDDVKQLFQDAPNSSWANMGVVEEEALEMFAHWGVMFGEANFTDEEMDAATLGTRADCAADAVAQMK